MLQSFNKFIQEQFLSPLNGKNVNELALIAVAFSIPLWPQLTIGLTVVWLLVVLTRSSFAAILSGLKFNPILLCSVAIYTMILIGLIWTSNFNSAFKECMDDIYLLLFPLCMVAFNYSKQDFQLVRKYFTLGALAACLICLIIGLFNSLSTGNIHELFYIKFSKLLHPTYFGAILIMALLFKFDSFNLRKQSSSDYAVIYILTITLILLCSKVTYLTALVVIGIRLLVSLLRKEKYLTLSLGNIVMVLVTVIVFVATQLTQSRIPQLINALEKTEISTASVSKTTDSTAYNSSTIRIAQAKYSFELIRKNPLWGSGTGDVVDDFRNILIEHNDQYGVDHFRLPHNFYFHILIMLGIPGLILVLLAMFIPLFWSIRKKQFLYMEFLLFILIMGMTDIYIHATLGTFFAFMYAMLYLECNAKLRS